MPHDRIVFKTSNLSGWGNTNLSCCEVMRPTKEKEIKQGYLRLSDNGVIPRGCGRSYGDESTNDDGRVIDLVNYNKHISIDTLSRIVICDSGVTIKQLVDRFLPDGLIPPVCPGTGFVTIGGAIANDVHGKNHDVHGSFGDHLLWMEILLPSGDVLRASREQHSDLFHATIGGIGLTGIILRASFKMLDIGSNAVRVNEEQISSLDLIMERILNTEKQNMFSVAWIDANAQGENLGRGILITANPHDAYIPVKRKITLSVPFKLPSWILNRYSVKIFNHFYYHRIRGVKESIQDFQQFVFPLDKIHNWNRLYGSKGAYQFQCVIPHEHAKQCIREILQLCGSESAASPLAVLKTMNRQGIGYLSFPKPGITLALDFPCTIQSRELIKTLYNMVLENSGRIYLAKDSCLSAKQLIAMYPELNKFLLVKKHYDPQGWLQSDTSRRLGISK